MDPSDAIVNAILADPGPAYASSSVTNVNSDPYKEQIEQRTKGLRTAFRGGITKRRGPVLRNDPRKLPPLPYDVMRKIAEHEITIKSLFDFALKEFKNFKFELTTEEAKPGGELIQLPSWRSSQTLTQDQKVKISFPRALGVLFPTVSWSDMDGVYKLNTLYTIGKLDETYETISKKFEFMGLPKFSYRSFFSRNVTFSLFHANNDFFH